MIDLGLLLYVLDYKTHNCILNVKYLCCTTKILAMPRANKDDSNTIQYLYRKGRIHLLNLSLGKTQDSFDKPGYVMNNKAIGQI